MPSTRCNYLSDMGKLVVPELLAAKGFTKIDELYKSDNPHPFATILAERDGERFAINLQVRNKFDKNGELNPRYKLGTPSEWQVNAEDATRRYSATPAFVAIAFEDETFDAYIGAISILSRPSTSGGRALNGNGIGMTDAHTKRYLELAKGKQHEFSTTDFSNRSEI